MLRTNSEYGSPYLVIWHVTLTFYFHFAQILRMMTAAAPLWAWDDDAEGHFKKQLFGTLHPSTLEVLTPEGKPFEGIRA